MIAVSFVLLILAFRTLVITPQAAAMNLLSIGASHGVPHVSIEGAEFFDQRDRLAAPEAEPVPVGALGPKTNS